ncbi:MAG: SagB/ThcOx family dehydrogenase, partial [Zoogloea sp.]|nr:SagB/ThcOx family dehydrogenase [Zoogloea sp.]
VIVDWKTARRRADPATLRQRLQTIVYPYVLVEASAGLPWDAWPEAPRVHPVLFVHRVDGLAPGAYLLARSSAGEAALRETLLPGMEWAEPDGCPDGLPLWRLAENPALAGSLRTICCHQALGSEAIFAVAMLAEFEPALQASPADYRSLFQEAGLLGHVLYLEAEAAGFAGTGIGCFFDDLLHQMMGIADLRFQSVYHFTVGRPLPDTRIASELPYDDRLA